MSLKITLVTPPDLFENDNESLFLINLDEQEQATATQWLGQFESDKDLNIYFYQGEVDMPWFLHALAVSKYKYINVDAERPLTSLMAGYILGKANVWYKTSDVNRVAVYSYINNNHVDNIITFFERVFGDN